MHVPQVRDAQSTWSTSSMLVNNGFKQLFNSNLTFGAGGKDKDGNVTAGWGYYEASIRFLSILTHTCLIRTISQQTIAGGSGAGPSWHGTSGVHTHITNTRIGDVEILERRYPVIVQRFGLREDDSGGKGKFKGGEGVVREMEFTVGMRVSILSEVRRMLLIHWMPF